MHLGGVLNVNQHMTAIFRSRKSACSRAETIPVEDEWDVESTCNKMIEERRVMIRAKFAGSGKSFIGKYMDNVGYNTFFVVPQNMLKQEI